MKRLTMLKIQATLLNPIRQPLAYAKVFFISMVPKGVPLHHAKAMVQADGEGNISFELVRGTYRVYLEQADIEVKYPVGYILDTIFDTATSPTGLTELIVEALPNEDNK